MIAIDFKDWHTYHCSLFPAVDGWLTKFPETQRREGEPTQQAVLGAWARVLADVDLKLAKQASDLLAKGQEEFLDRTYDCHPRTVRMIALKLAGSRKKQMAIEGEEVYDCGACRDSGIVEVWVPKLLEWAVDAFDPDDEPPPGTVLSWQRDPRLQDRPKGIPYSCVIACNCARGQSKKKAMRGYVFNPERHVQYDPWKFWEAMDKTRELLAARGGF